MKLDHRTTEYSRGAISSRETLDAMEELGAVLKTIYMQMKKEGFRIVDGKIVNIYEEGKSETENSRGS